MPVLVLFCVVSYRTERGIVFYMYLQKSIFYYVSFKTGPCGGKTTGQARLCTFFENLGWKVCLKLL